MNCIDSLKNMCIDQLVKNHAILKKANNCGTLKFWNLRNQCLEIIKHEESFHHTVFKSAIKYLDVVEEIHLAHRHVPSTLVQAILDKYKPMIKVLHLHPKSYSSDVQFGEAPFKKLEAITLPQLAAAQWEAVKTILPRHVKTNLTLSDCTSLDFLKGWPQMVTSLTIEDIWITEAKLQNITQQFPFIEMLDISDCRQIGTLSGCSLKKLKVLNASYSGLTNKGLEDLCRVEAHKNLQLLDISGTVISSFGRCRVFPSLKILRACGSSLGDAGLREGSIVFGSQLEALDVRLCEGISSFQECGPFPRLKYINASGSGLTNPGLQSLINKCSLSLEVLNISGCQRISSLHGCKPLPFLKKLNVYRVQGGSHLLRDIQRICGDSLEELDITECTNITSFEACPLFPRLNTVIAYRSGINQPGKIEQFKQRYPFVKVLYSFDYGRLVLWMATKLLN